MSIPSGTGGEREAPQKQSRAYAAARRASGPRLQDASYGLGGLGLYWGYMSYGLNLRTKFRLGGPIGDT